LHEGVVRAQEHLALHAPTEVSILQPVHHRALDLGQQKANAALAQAAFQIVSTPSAVASIWLTAEHTSSTWRAAGSAPPAPRCGLAARWRWRNTGFRPPAPPPGRAR
jgi:hypothetical protein